MSPDAAAELTPGEALVATYDPLVVVWAIVIAVAASYVALELTGRLRDARPRAKALWRFSGSVVLGLGIWSMHFTGMLAMHLPAPMHYHLPEVMFSSGLAVAASALALWLTDRPVMSATSVLAGGAIMGLAIAGMHYVGMMAMDLPARISYDPARLTLSILVAVAAACVALWLAGRNRDDRHADRVRDRGLAAVVMGVAISGMHFVGMSAAQYTVIEAPATWAATGAIDPEGLSTAVIAGTLLIMALTLVSTTVGRQLDAQADAIARQRETFHSALSTISDLVFIYARGGRLVYANQALLDLFGMPADQLIGKTVDELPNHHDLAQRVKQHIEHVITTRETVRDETAFTFPTGQSRFYEYILRPIVASDGSCELVAGSTRDITAFKRVAEERENAARQQGGLATLGRFALSAEDEAALLDEVAAVVTRQFGVGFCTVRQLVAGGQRLRTRASVGWPPRLDCDLEVTPNSVADYLLASREPVVITDLQYETRFDTAPLRHHAIASGMAVVIDGREGAWGVLEAYTSSPRAFSEDDVDVMEAVSAITGEALRRRQVEADLRESEARNLRDLTEMREARTTLARQAALLDQARDAILVRDLEHRILYLNQGAERLLGWTADEARGRKANELFQAEDAGYQRASRQLAERGEWTGELKKMTKRGEQVVVDSRWTLVPGDGSEPPVVLSIETDITERRRLEAQFLRAQRLEGIGTLAGGIAHDLNNVLTPITMGVDLLLSEETDPARVPVLRTIQASARRGAEMVGQVLAFARGVDGRRSPIRVRHLLEDVAKIAGETFPKNIAISCDVDAGLPDVVGDPTQLHQVLINLCVNGRDAMPDGGQLFLLAREVTIDQHYAGLAPDAKPGRYARIEVRDTGQGIAESIIGRIFEPFFTTKAIGRGSGLGLSTSMAIITSHGGFARVHSEIGKGTTFHVYLPFGESAGALPAPESHLPRGRGETVLVVDDEASVRDITKQTLESFGYRVLLATDGADAIARYATDRSRIDVVLTDIMMPVMDGAAAIRVLLRMNPDVKIIAASGLASEARVTDAVAAGVTHFLAKPYTADSILRTLRRILGGEE